MSRRGRTTVVNLRDGAYDVYCGRAGHGHDGYFGNPHVVGYCELCERPHARGEAVMAFKVTFEERLRADHEYARRVWMLKGKVLGCFCKPALCHCDVIADWLNSK